MFGGVENCRRRYETLASLVSTHLDVRVGLISAALIRVSRDDSLLPTKGAKRPLWRVWQGDSRGLRVWWFGVSRGNLRLISYDLDLGTSTALDRAAMFGQCLVRRRVGSGFVKVSAFFRGAF
jgi:hypothetical protein